MKPSKIQIFFLYAIVGIGIGSIVSAIVLMLVFGMTEMIQNLIVWLIASGIFGLISLVYESERFSLLTATCIHAPVVFGTALIFGWLLGYGDGSILLLLRRMLPIIILTYIIVHFILFLIRRTAVQDVNSRLKK